MIVIIKILASSSKGNCYLISDGKTRLLLDCGIPIARIRQKCGFAVHNVEACLLSHEHKDHSRAAADLAKAGMDIYATRGTIDACGLSGHRIRAIESSIKTEFIGSFKVLPFPVVHDAAEPVGFLITSSETGETLVYVTDSEYVSYKFKDLNYVMIECNFDSDTLFAKWAAGHVPPPHAERLTKSHMSLENLLEMLEANDLSKVKQIYLLHMSDGNADAAKIKKAVQEATGVEVYVA